MTAEQPHGDFVEINVGDVLCGRYRADRLIDRSETGIVVAGTDMLRGDGVAIKMIEPRLPEAEEVELLAARLRREAHVLSQLTSPHVVRVFDVQKHGNMVCLVMELLQGGNLGQVMRKRDPMGIEEAVGIILQACDALAEAHAIGIVHRDIKPQNLYLTQRPDGSNMLKVLDFGVSKQQGGMGLTATGAALGSPLYTAVEQFRDASRVDARADIWSLGLVLYFLLCRRNAFDADNPVALMLKIATSPPTPLRERRPDVPADLEAVILQCVEKDRERRFSNVGAFARALVPFGPPWAASFLPSIEARLSRRSLPSLPPAAASIPPPADARRGSSPSWPNAGAPQQGEAQRGSSPSVPSLARQPMPSTPAVSDAAISSGRAPNMAMPPPAMPAAQGAPAQQAWVPAQGPMAAQQASGPPAQGVPAQQAWAPALGAPAQQAWAPALGAPAQQAWAPAQGAMAAPQGAMAAPQGAPTQQAWAPAPNAISPAPERRNVARQVIIFALAFLAAAALAAIGLAAVSWLRRGG